MTEQTETEKDQDFGQESTKALMAKGLTPHTTKGPFGESTSWENPNRSEFSWPMAAVLIMLVVAFLVVLKGWPF